MGSLPGTVGSEFLVYLAESAERANNLWCLDLEFPLPEGGRGALERGERLLASLFRALQEEGLLPSALRPIRSSFERFGPEGLVVLQRVLAPWLGSIPLLMQAPFGESARAGLVASEVVFDAWKADAAILTPWVGLDFLQGFLARTPGRGSYFDLRASLASTPWGVCERSQEDSRIGSPCPAWRAVTRSLVSAPGSGQGFLVSSRFQGDLAQAVSVLNRDQSRPVLISDSGPPGLDLAGVAQALRLSNCDRRTIRVGGGEAVVQALGRPGGQALDLAVQAARGIHELLRLNAPVPGRQGEPIRVFLVEDYGLVRRAFRGMLEFEQDIAVVGEVTTAEEALERIPLAHPDVVLLDLGLPGMDGLEATRRLRALDPKPRIVVLSASEDFEDVVASLQAGAHGYMHKRIQPEELVDSVRRASRNEPVIPRDMLASYLEFQAREKRSQAPLSQREQEVLVHLASGCTNREVAQRLFTAEGTVKTHVRNIYRKLGISTREEALAHARSAGLL